MDGMTVLPRKTRIWRSRATVRTSSTEGDNDDQTASVWTDGPELLEGARTLARSPLHRSRSLGDLSQRPRIRRRRAFLVRARRRLELPVQQWRLLDDHSLVPRLRIFGRRLRQQRLVELRGPLG